MRLKGNLEDVLKKPKPLTQFLKYANALLNGRAGNIVIHSSDHNLLEKFDQKVDPKLKDLLSDGSMYHNVFERSYFDPYHLVYRVKPSAGRRVWSTLDFKSKVSYNKGIEPPSYRNMSVCIDTLCATSPELGDHRQTQEKFVFELGEEVVVWKKKEQNEEEVEVFQESMTLQAKAIHIQAEREPDYGLLRLKLADHCWNSLKLKEYITAFTKIRGGGSIFLGVSEHKTRQVAWELPDPNIVNGPFTVAGEQWGVWQDKHGPDPPIVYHLAREAKTNEQATGQFITDAFQLTDYEKECFQDDILERVRKLKWIGITDHSGVVQVDFHDVNINGNHGDGCCVIEIKINYYHGLCFYDTEGPESYRCRPPIQGSIFQSKPELERIQVNDWIKSFKSQGDEHMDELNNLPMDQRVGRCFFCFSLL
ncbi:uncharacterized protein [Littorina saxatilis]|uniref:uncharacterized protein n=1 Tax=Littorina saxatilis TaxID=31220 RepID=UPI0038B59B2B